LRLPEFSQRKHQPNVKAMSKLLCFIGFILCICIARARKSNFLELKIRSLSEGHAQTACPSGASSFSRCLGHLYTQSFGDALTVGRIRLVELADLALLDFPWHRLHRAHDIPDQLGLLIRAHQTEQVPRLGAVIVADAVIVTVGIPGKKTVGSSPAYLPGHFSYRLFNPGLITKIKAADRSQIVFELINERDPRRYVHLNDLFVGDPIKELDQGS